MPSSAVSASSHSSTSTGSRRAKTKQYHKISATSNVDESLFGEQQHVLQRQELLEEKWSKNNSANRISQDVAIALANQQNRRQSKKNREMVQVITKDLIRNLIIPHEDPSGQSIILPRDELFRIMAAARVYSKAEREAEAERIKKEKEAAQDAAEERKAKLKAYDIARQKNEGPSELDQELQERADHLLDKANLMRQEQEDEIKHLNELILNAKCHAIRDAQVLEKQQIKKEMMEEERRLDLMMEVERQNAIRVQEEIERRRKDEQLIGASKLMEQIQEIDRERLFGLERKDQENIQMQRYIEKLMEEDQSNLERERAMRRALRDELNQANTEILARQAVRKDQEKIEDMKVLEFQRRKAERDAAYEREQEKIRIEKERETARLRALQERARDEQAERDALRAKRAQEEAEREWRQKEAEAERKKAETEAILREARAQQLEQKEHYLAVQAQRERAEFERILRAQKENIEREKKEEDENRKKKLQHADEIRAQIRQKEQQQVLERNNFFEEGVRLDQEARERRMRLEDIKKRKLTELRDAGIPEKYLSQVERKVNEAHHMVV